MTGDRRPPATTGAPARVRQVATDELSEAELAEIRALMGVAFGDDPEEAFTDDDWAHALGGLHVLVEVDGRIVAHAALVERELRVGGRAVRTGYVEAVATAPERQGEGFGSRAMAVIGAEIQERFELGALGTGAFRFYERLGWRRWPGPSQVRLPDGTIERSPEDDGFLMILETPRSGTMDDRPPIECDWRPGDAW